MSGLAHFVGAAYATNNAAKAMQEQLGNNNEDEEPITTPSTTTTTTETFTDDQDKKCNSVAKNILIFVMNVINIIIFVWAVYLSFKVNDGFDPLHFLLACCCSICYLPYGLWMTQSSPVRSQTNVRAQNTRMQQTVPVQVAQPQTRSEF